MSEEIESKIESEIKHDDGGEKDTENGVEALEQMVQYLVNHVSSSGSSSDGKFGRKQPNFKTLLDQADSQLHQLLTTQKHGGVGDIKNLLSDRGSLDAVGHGLVKRCNRMLYAVHDTALLVVNHALQQRLISRKTTTTTATTTTKATTTTATTTAATTLPDKGQTNVKCNQGESTDHDNDLLLVHGAWLVHKASNS